MVDNVSLLQYTVALSLSPLELILDSSSVLICIAVHCDLVLPTLREKKGSAWVILTIIRRLVADLPLFWYFPLLVIREGFCKGISKKRKKRFKC